MPARKKGRRKVARSNAQAERKKGAVAQNGYFMPEANPKPRGKRKARSKDKAAKRR